jgi:hypothetical protein
VSEACDQVSELVGSIDDRELPRLANHLQLRVGQGGGEPAAVFEEKNASSSDQAISAHFVNWGRRLTA